MKKKLLLFISMIAVLVCVLAISISAATVYKDSDGNELFRCEFNSSKIITSYTGSFPKTDADGNALTWYVTSTVTVGSDTIKTVASVLTTDEAYFSIENGEYTYTSSVVTQFNVVSVNYPSDAGITTLGLANDGFRYDNTYSYKPDITEILFVYLPSTLTVLPERIAQGSKMLVCEMPSEMPITLISHVAFYATKCLREINIPSAVKAINGKSAADGAAFYQCVSLQRVTFGENSQLQEIQRMAFNGCSALCELTLPDSLLTLGDEAFRGTVLVDSPFTKNSQCKSIGLNCFAQIKTLKSMVIPAGIVELDAMKFLAYCENLESVSFANNSQLKVIKKDCFCGTSVNNGKAFSKLVIDTLPDTVEIVEDFAFIGTATVNSPFSVNSQCTFIGHQAFANCKYLVEVNIPKNAEFVTDLSSYVSSNKQSGVFFGCTSLKTVSFHEDTTVKVLPTYMFASCSSLEYIKIPNSVTTLSARMFDRCTSLETIVLGENVTSLNYGRSWSDNHNSLTYGCTSLKYVYMSSALDMSTGHTDACHVFSTQDYSGNFQKLTIFINGDYDEAVRIQNGFKSVKTCNCNDRVNDSLIISLDEYNALEAVTENYIVYGYNTCDAFYDGEHGGEDDGDCTTAVECERCEKELLRGYDSHDNQSIVEYANGYMNEGCKKDGCVRCSVHTEVALSPLFACLGYSAPESGVGSITVGFVANIEAIEEYTTQTGKAVVYGVFVALQQALGDKDVFDEDGNASSGVVSAEVSGFGNSVFELKLIGIAEDKRDVMFALGAYTLITDGETAEYSYLQSHAPEAGETYYFTSYNHIVGKASV